MTPEIINILLCTMGILAAISGTKKKIRKISLSRRKPEPTTSKKSLKEAFSVNPLKEAGILAITLFLAGSAILWHQGENQKEKLSDYEQKIRAEANKSVLHSLDVKQYTNILRKRNLDRETLLTVGNNLARIQKEHPHIKRIYTIINYQDGQTYRILDTLEDPTISVSPPMRTPERVEIDDPLLKEAINSPIRMRASHQEPTQTIIPLEEETQGNVGILVLETTPPESITQKKTLESIALWALLSLTFAGIFWNFRKKTNEIASKVAKEEEKLLKITKTVPGVVYIYKVTKESGRGFLFLSNGVESLYGIPAERARQEWRKIEDFIPTSYVQEANKSLAHSAATFEPWLHRYKIIHPQEGEKWIQNHAQPSKEPDGSITWNGVFSDITKEILAAKLREKGDAIFQLISKGKPLKEVLSAVAEYVESELFPAKMGVYIPQLTEQGEILKLIAAPGYTEVMQKTLHEINIGEKEGNAAVAALTQEPVTIQDIATSNFWKKNKEIILGEGVRSCWAYPIRNKEGRLLAVVELFRNRIQNPDPFQSGENLGKSGYPTNKTMATAMQITQTAIERHQAQQDLKKNEERYRSLFESSPIGICQTWRQTWRSPSETGEKPPTPNKEKILYANKAFCQLLERPLEDIEGKELKELISPKGNDFETETPSKTTKTLFKETASISRPDGSESKIHFLSDITERKKGEEALLRSKEIAEAANKGKSEFLATMSHEIRTPMNGIIGYTELIGKTVLDQTQKRYIQTIRSCGKTLLTIIDDILNLSKIEAGKVELEKKPFLFKEVVEEILLLLKPNAEKKGLQLTIRYEANIPKAILGDEDRLKQILVNLGGNAIKFTDKGAVSIHIQTDPKNKQDSNQKNLLIHVIDTGIGIPLKTQEKLFQPFSQADSSTSKRFGGTGLGLVISRKLTQMMGGDISLTSKEGQGSTFTIHLPIKEVNPQEVLLSKEKEGWETPHPTDQVAGIPLRILVAEDDETNRTLLEDLLLTENHDVKFAKNGEETLKLTIEQSKTGNFCELFDLVLMDMQMPKMDGIEATQKIREAEKEGKLYIVALTANVMEADRKRCLDAGMDDFLNKPIRFNQLQEIIRKIQKQKLARNDFQQEELPSSNNPQENPEAQTQNPPENKTQEEPSPSEEKPPENKKENLKKQEEELLNLESIQEIVEMNPKLIHSMMEKNQKTNEERLITLKTQMGSANYADTRKKILHAIKGSVGTLGLKTMFELCLQLEEKNPQTLGEQEAEVILLENTYNESIQTLKNWTEKNIPQ